MFQEEKLRRLLNPKKDDPALLRIIGGEPPQKPLLNHAGEEIYHPGHQQSVQGLYWLSDTQLLSLSGAEICAWNPTTGEKLRWFELPGTIASRWLVLPEHRSAVLLVGEQKIVWVDLEEGRPLHSFKISGAGSMFLSRDGAHLFFLMKEKLIAWSLEGRTLLWEKRIEASSLSAEHGVVTVFLQRQIIQYKIDSGEEIATLLLGGRGRCLCYHSQRISTQHEPGQAFTFHCYLPYELHAGMKSIALAAKEDWIAVGFADGAIGIFELFVEDTNKKTASPKNG
jgi:hypothetical protein